MKKKVLASVLALGMAISLAACGGAASGTSGSSEPAPAAAEEETKVEEAVADAASTEQVEAAVATEEAAADDAAAGFQEYPIWEDEEVGGLMNVSGVYFQPVPMTDGSDPADYNMHFEADIAALEGNKLGYGAGDWIPYLTVDYAIINSKGETAAEGTFMPMSASDGPHYGANIKLADADTYSVKLTFHSPAENNYLLHTDAETGPGAASFDEYFPDGKLELELKDVWDYTPQEW
ncbi:MAG: iron transporter [Eubacteriales bacterium]|nr:iron transporter [Eubacteriales bacterium]